MKHKVLILLLFISVSINGQNLTQLPIGDWIMSHIETNEGTKLYNDLGFRRIRIKSHNSIDIFSRRIFDENNLTFESYSYSINGKSIRINTDPQIEFTIENVSNTGFILNKNNNNYFFKKLLIVNSKSFLRNRFEYKIIDTDTTAIVYFPQFKGDFFKYFTVNYNTQSAFLVETSFILRENGQIDSITIVPPINDSTIISIATNMIKSSQKKWRPVTTTFNDKIDDWIQVAILFKSSELKKVKILNYTQVCSSIFSRAFEAHNNEQYGLAEKLYSDNISMFKFIIYNSIYVGASFYPTLKLDVNDLNDGLFNRAALRFELEKDAEACKDLQSIAGNKKDVQKAARFMQSYCK